MINDKAMKAIFRTFLFVLLGVPVLLPTAQAQVPTLKDPTVNFSLQASPIFPSSLFRVRANEGVSEAGVAYSINTNIGFSFGGIATFRLSEKFQIHGGISLLRRNYENSASFGDETVSIELRTTVYDIPIVPMYYQRLSERMLLSIGTGVSIQATPSNLENYSAEMDVIAERRRPITPTSLTIAGLELRQDKGGFFFGLSYSITPFPLYDTTFRAQFGGQDDFFRLPHVGDYFGLVLRYYME